MCRCWCGSNVLLLPQATVAVVAFVLLASFACTSLLLALLLFMLLMLVFVCGVDVADECALSFFGVRPKSKCSNDDSDVVESRRSILVTLVCMASNAGCVLAAAVASISLFLFDMISLCLDVCVCVICRHVPLVS